MKINDIQPIRQLNEYTKNQKFAKEEHAAPKNKKKDEVSISPEAKKMLHAEQKGSIEDEQRTEKIEALKHAVSTGTYHVDAKKLANKIYPHIK